MKQPITRRTMLKGVGATLGLPLLEAMRPLAACAGEGTGKPPVRMAFLYMPNGVHGGAWAPKGVGKDFELSSILQPLAKVKSETIIFSELMNKATDTGDGHYVKLAAFLTGTTITRTTGSEVCSGGISVDQLAAQRVGNLTMLPSLELGIEPITTGVDVNVGYTRLYGSHIAWSSPTTPVAKEIDPRLAFNRLFRTEPRASASGKAGEASVLDLVKEDANRLRAKVSGADQKKLEEYLTSVRAVEKRIEFDGKRRAAETKEDPKAREAITALEGRIRSYYDDPARVSERGINHTEHVRIMLELMVLAFWTDSTRISTFMFGNGVSGKNFSFLEGVQGGHHHLSHHEGNKDKLEQYRRINVWHIEQLAHMLERMKQIKEGESTLLDNSMILFGSGMKDGNAHSPHNLPLVFAGRGGGTIKTGRHIAYPKDTPLCKLYVAMLNRMGVPTAKFADGEGELPGLEDENFGVKK